MSDSHNLFWVRGDCKYLIKMWIYKS